MPTVEIPRPFKRKLKKKPEALRTAILKCIGLLTKNPKHPGLHCHKVGGTKGVWEAYVDDANRVTFEYIEGGIRLRNHCNHAILDKNP